MRPSPHILDLRPYHPGKPTDELRRELGLADVVKLASNENPLGPSPRSAAALRAAADRVGEYPDAACFRLTGALAAHWNVAPEQIVVGNGSDEILHLLGLAFLQPGDQALTGHPSFVRYEAAAVLNRAEFVQVPLAEHRFDLPALARRVTPRTRLVFIANPNNPTGTIVSRRELEGFLDSVHERSLVVLDEAYFEYADDPDYPDGLDYLRQGRNVIVLRTFSKIYALAGLRVGYGIAHPEVASALHRVREPFNVNSLAQEAALASLEDPEQVARGRRLALEGREQVSRGCARLGLACHPTQANFVVVDLRRDSRPVFEALLRRGVIVRAGDDLGLPGCLRVTIGTAELNDRFLDELGAVLQGAEPEVMPVR